LLFWQTETNGKRNIHGLQEEMSRLILIMLLAGLFSANLYPQDASEVDESSLSKKELRQLHREQRKAEREAKREERQHRQDADVEAETRTDVLEQTSAAPKQVKQQNEEVEEAVEKALLEHEQTEEKDESTPRPVRVRKTD
jgi:uncharacterized membrane protein